MNLPEYVDEYEVKSMFAHANKDSNDFFPIENLNSCVKYLIMRDGLIIRNFTHEF